MTYGLKIKRSKANDVMDFCEKNHIDYLLWNAEGFWFGKEDAEMDFNTQEDREQVGRFLAAVANTELFLSLQQLFPIAQ